MLLAHGQRGGALRAEARRERIEQRLRHGPGVEFREQLAGGGCVHGGLQVGRKEYHRMRKRRGGRMPCHGAARINGLLE
jgi:hypothetical protein